MLRAEAAAPNNQVRARARAATEKHAVRRVPRWPLPVFYVDARLDRRRYRFVTARSKTRIVCTSHEASPNRPNHQSARGPSLNESRNGSYHRAREGLRFLLLDEFNFAYAEPA